MSIDQVSAAIGELKAEATSSKNQRAALFDQVGDIKQMVADLTVVIQTNITKDDIKIAEMEKDIKSHGSSIGELKKFKQRMLIGIAAIGGTGGVVGALTTGLANKLGLGQMLTLTYTLKKKEHTNA